MQNILLCVLARYVRLLGAFYMRLTGNSLDCYNYLEPLYNDYRKVKRKKSDGGTLLCAVTMVMYNNTNSPHINCNNTLQDMLYYV